MPWPIPHRIDQAVVTPCRTLRLDDGSVRVDVRLVEPAVDRWIASADAPEGPTLGVGTRPEEALVGALLSLGPRGEMLLDGLPDGILDWLF